MQNQGTLCAVSLPWALLPSSPWPCARVLGSEDSLTRPPMSVGPLLLLPGVRAGQRAPGQCYLCPSPEWGVGVPAQPGVLSPILLPHTAFWLRPHHWQGLTPCWLRGGEHVPGIVGNHCQKKFCCASAAWHLLAASLCRGVRDPHPQAAVSSSGSLWQQPGSYRYSWTKQFMCWKTSHCRFSLHSFSLEKVLKCCSGV